MNDIKNKITAVILAGGQSRRFNYRDKGLLNWHGKPLINHVISLLENQTSQIIINCNRNKDRYKALGYALCHDKLKDFQGPLAGIQAALPLSKTPLTLICPCDTPNLPINLSERLASALLNQSLDLAYPLCQRRSHYLPVLLKTELLTSINNYLKGSDRSMKGWYATVASAAVPFDSPESAFSNLNRPEDLKF
jgi:molybdopterin-guanine dinucleotide biosynthesis protein A